MTKTVKSLWQRMDGPLKVGVFFAALGIILTIIGIIKDPTTPLTTWSLSIGSLISGGTWGLVSWAIATAAVEVENDVHQVEVVAQENTLSNEETDEPA